MRSVTKCIRIVSPGNFQSRLGLSQFMLRCITLVEVDLALFAVKKSDEQLGSGEFV